MTWVEFNNAVRDLLPQHNRRQGIQPMLDRAIAGAVIDLQRHIPELQRRHRDVVAYDDLFFDGDAQYGDLPPGRVIAFRLLRFNVQEDEYEASTFMTLRPVPWTDVESMKAGCIAGYLVATNAQLGRYYISRPLDEDVSLVVEWSGLKQTFNDDDIVVFEEGMIETVANYVRWKLAGPVDHDMGLVASESEQYRRGRRSIFGELHGRIFPDELTSCQYTGNCGSYLPKCRIGCGPTVTLCLTRGDTGRWEVEITHPDTGAVVDLTNTDLKMAVWKSKPAADVDNDDGAEFVLTSDPEDGIDITDAVNGKVTITISNTRSEGLTSKYYYFDLQLTTVVSETFTAASGVIRVEPQITH